MNESPAQIDDEAVRDHLSVMNGVREKGPFDWLSALQLGLGVVAALGLWAFSALMALGGGFLLIGEGEWDSLTAMWATAAALFFAGFLVFVSAWYGGRRLAKPESPSPEIPMWIRRVLKPRNWAFLLPVIWLAALVMPKSGALAVVFFPLINLLGIGLPVWLVVSLAKRGLPGGSPQRQWGLFTTGMVFSTAAIVVLELLAAALMVAFALLLNPELVAALSSLLDNPSSVDALEIDRILSHHLDRREVMIFGIVFIAGLVPVFEELLKPIGVWLLARRKLTPSAGFVAGAISGAGFALFESMLGAAQPTLWPSVMLARAGTAAMHTLATGISGWGLAQAFTHRRYGRALLSYLAAVGLHALWNGVPVILAGTTLAGEINERFDLAKSEAAATGLFVFMGLAALAFLVYINRRLAGDWQTGTPAGG